MALQVGQVGVGGVEQNMQSVFAQRTVDEPLRGLPVTVRGAAE
ncbi:MAG TPA: hypothetical protein VIP11_22140 [Gemmatimonadaceae bacterium]